MNGSSNTFHVIDIVSIIIMVIIIIIKIYITLCCLQMRGKVGGVPMAMCRLG